MADQQLNDIEAQKAALLASIAQQGSQGQQAFAAEQARRQATQQAAVGQIVKQSQMTGVQGAAPAGATAQLAKQQGDLGNIYAQDAAMAGQTFQNSMANTSAANAAYMNAAGAALPIVQAQTAGQVAQIRAEQEAAAAEREARLEEMRLDAEEAQKEREFAQQEREAASKDERTALEEEAEAKRQDDLIIRATTQRPVAAKILAGITDSVNTIEQAIAIAPQIIDSVLASESQASLDQGGSGKVWTKEDRKELYRYLYEFYTGDRAPTDPNELADAYTPLGVKVTDIPGYMPKDDRVRERALKALPAMQEKATKTAAFAIGRASKIPDNLLPRLEAAIRENGRPPRDSREAWRWVAASTGN